MGMTSFEKTSCFGWYEVPQRSTPCLIYCGFYNYVVRGDALSFSICMVCLTFWWSSNVTGIFVLLMKYSYLWEFCRIGAWALNICARLTWVLGCDVFRTAVARTSVLFLRLAIRPREGGGAKLAHFLPVRLIQRWPCLTVGPRYSACFNRVHRQCGVECCICPRVFYLQYSRWYAGISSLCTIYGCILPKRNVLVCFLRIDRGHLFYYLWYSSKRNT